MSSVSELAELPVSRGIVTVIEPRSGWQAIEFHELWRYRELVWFLALRDIKVRYKQTVLGATWAIIQPVMTMIVFTIFFGRLGGMDRNVTTAYPVFIYAALLPWQLFSGSITQCGQSLISSSNLISKVYFPRLIIPLSSLGSGVVDFVVSFTVMLVLMAWYQVIPGVQFALIPILVAGTILAAFGVGTWLSAMMVAYRDFRYVVPFMVQLWMFASPVAYPITVVPDRWRVLYSLNPMAGLIGGFRSALLNEPMLWDCLLVSLAVSFAVFVAGAYQFRRTERRFADIV